MKSIYGRWKFRSIRKKIFINYLIFFGKRLKINEYNYIICIKFISIVLNLERYYKYFLRVRNSWKNVYFFRMVIKGFKYLGDIIKIV